MNTSNNHVSTLSELEVLSRIFKDNKLIHKATEDISSKDFFNLKNQTIFEQMILHSKKDKAISPVTIFESLKGSEITLSYLMEIEGVAASTKDLKSYIDIVKENSNKRKMVSILENSLNQLSKQTYEDVSHEIMNNLYQASEKNSKGNFLDDTEVMGLALDFLEKAQKSNGESVGMRTGWKGLDKALKGFHKGDLVLIGGRPSMGKTILMLQLSRQLSDKYSVGIMELEMTHEKLALRRLAAESYIPLNRIYQAHELNQGEFDILIDNINKFASRNRIFTDTTPRMTLDQIRNKVRYLKSTKDIDILFVDHVGLIRMDKRYANRNDGIGEITSELKSLAKEFDICIVALSQLSRAVEARADKRPMLSDLRDSGSLEQDADVVIFLYRDGYYTSDKDSLPDLEPLEIIIAKNRDGMTGTIDMTVSLSKQRIGEFYR